jgi:hypothetical protein
MKYRLRLNGNPNLETLVEHVETVNDEEVLIDNTGIFNLMDIVVTKFELIGDDDEVYAMRKLPPHLSINTTSSDSLSIQFRLRIQKDIIPI